MRGVSFFALIILAVSFAGCATTKKDVSSEQLQMRISDMEKQIDQKSLEIEDLKDQVSELNDQLKQTESTAVANQKAAASSPQLTSVDKNIIRVSASPKDIQTCLKNAGFYSGIVDGKIGDQTKKAISAFQQANGLGADGVIGKKTWSKLKTYLY